MEFNGEYTIPTDRLSVWRALHDPDVLKPCLDGCESLEWTTDTEMAARFKTTIGPVSARFTGTLALSEVDPPESYLLTAQGQGGAAGFFKGSARVTLSETGPKLTLLRYQSDATVGGKLASVGSRLLRGAVEKTADDFFRKLSERIGEGGAAAIPAPPMHRPDAPTPITGRAILIALGVALGVTAILAAVMALPG
jgi:carbon monoxide dehydrogenase subunit G